MTFNTITDHVDQAQKRQVRVFKDKTNINKIIKIRAQRIQHMEDVLNQMINERALSTASGVQLNGLGEFYGEQGDRNNRSDPEYIAFLKVLPAKLRQAGQHEVLIQALANLTGAINIETEYYWPRAMALNAIMTDIDSITNESDINDEMQAIRAQGVRLDVVFKQDEGNFLFADNDEGDVPLNSGFASLDDGSDGGAFTKIIG